MIASQTQLDELVSRLRGEKKLAVDCEMDSMYAYSTSLCVVQIGWPGGEALIDAMVEYDRSGLGALFADPDVVTIFHGGENDIGLMRSRWGLDFNGVFDTMAASQVLGHEGVGLAALLERNFDVKVSKKFQKADWRVRPLPEEQAEYARIDVRYLIPLHDLLLQELTELGRVEEAESEFLRITAACLEDKPFDPDNWARMKAAKDLDPKKRATLRELYVARDEIARALDRAPYRVLHESALLDLAQRQPKNTADLRRMRGVSKHLRGEHVERLLAAIAKGRKVTDLDVPKRKRGWRGDRFGGARMESDQIVVFDRLRAWRQKRADSRGVAVARVATNALLAQIARDAPASIEALGAVAGMEDWRVREYGDEILGVVQDGAE
ncbi:MAG: ribonuclease D [Planctomycetota bacterium]|jgi:ribonuclease D